MLQLVAINENKNEISIILESILGKNLKKRKVPVERKNEYSFLAKRNGRKMYENVKMTRNEIMTSKEKAFSQFSFPEI